MKNEEYRLCEYRYFDEEACETLSILAYFHKWVVKGKYVRGIVEGRETGLVFLASVDQISFAHDPISLEPRKLSKV